MDDVDIAGQEIERQLEAELANKRAAQVAAQAIPSADNCTYCGVGIPSERQIAVPGCQLCIDCAERLETINRGIKRI